MNATRLALAVTVLAAIPGLAPSFAQPAPHSGAVPPQTAALADTARVRKWHDEVRYIANLVHTQHPRPFTRCPAASFDSAARAIEARIPTTDDTRLAVECMRMVALIRDGHTLLIGTFPPLGFTSVLPIALRPFEDGLYVVAADSAHAAALGAKVVRMGDVSADEALARVASATSADNRFTELDRAPLFLMLPAMLNALGVSHERDRVALELERAGGKRERLVLNGGAPPDGFPQAFLETEPRYPAAWVSARRVAADRLPRCDQRPGDAWWFEYLPDSKVLYLRMRQIDPVSDRLAYPEFYRQLFFAADSLKPHGLIVDLRHNHGGNNSVDDPLVRGIEARPWLDREGGVIAMIDRGTFSAAMNAAVFLSDQTHARFAGEPTGGGYNHYGDAPHGTTPNFGMLFQVSTVPWLGRYPQDPRPYIAPDVAVPWTFADWRDGKDAGLDAAIDAIWNGTLPVRVLEAARRQGAPAGKAAYDTWVKEHPNPWSQDPAAQIPAFASELGDRLAWRDAATLSEAWTLIAPSSAPAWRHLGEAEYHLGQRDAAVAACRKAISLTSFAPMARLLLERMGEKP